MHTLTFKASMNGLSDDKVLFKCVNKGVDLTAVVVVVFVIVFKCNEIKINLTMFV